MFNPHYGTLMRARQVEQQPGRPNVVSRRNGVPGGCDATINGVEYQGVHLTGDGISAGVDLALAPIW